jgi:hypothetical protein
MWLATVKKALAGAIAAGLAALGTSVADGVVTGAEWGIVFAAVVGGFAVVYLTPKNTNDSTAGRRL